MGKRADAAAELDRVLRRLDDRFNGRAIDRLTLEGTVEIDHMEPFEAHLLEGFGLGRGIVVVNGRRVHFAELETDALAVLQVDCWKEDLVGHAYGFQRRKLAIRARPRVWLFSG